MAVSARIFIKIVLMIFFCRIIVFQWSDFDCKYLMTTAFQFHDTFYDSLRLCIGIVDACLVLCSGIITLFVEDCWVNDVKICQEQMVKTYLCRIVFNTHGFAKTGFPAQNCLILGICFACAVGITALGIYDARYGLHQLFQPPEAASCKIDDVFFFLGKIHNCDLLDLGDWLLFSRLLHTCVGKAAGN